MMALLAAVLQPQQWHSFSGFAWAHDEMVIKAWCATVKLRRIASAQVILWVSDTAIVDGGQQLERGFCTDWRPVLSAILLTLWSRHHSSTNRCFRDGSRWRESQNIADNSFVCNTRVKGQDFIRSVSVIHGFSSVDWCVLGFKESLNSRFLTQIILFA